MKAVLVLVAFITWFALGFVAWWCICAFVSGDASFLMNNGSDARVAWLIAGFVTDCFTFPILGTIIEEI